MPAVLDVQTRRDGGLWFGRAPVVRIPKEVSRCGFDVEIEFGVEKSGPDSRIAVRRFEVRAREGTAVTAGALRLPFRSLVDLALRHAAEVYEIDDDGNKFSRIPSRKPTSAEVQAAFRPYRAPTGRRVSEKDLKVIVAVAKQAARAGESIPQAVMEIGYERAQAQRHLRALRAVGRLPHSTRSIARSSRGRRRS